MSFFDRQQPSLTRRGLKSCEFSSSPPFWPRYHCQPVANAFHLRALSGPCILDHIRTGGWGCQVTSAKNVGTPKIQPTSRRRSFKRGGVKNFPAETRPGPGEEGE